MPWSPHSRLLKPGVLHVSFSEGATPVSVRRLLHALRDEAGFRESFRDVLAAAPFEAFFWETPALSLHTLDRPFECVLVEARSLIGTRPDPSAFAEKFAHAPEQAVLGFPNLGGDAFLIVPGPRSESRHYGHLAAFVRSNPGEQAGALWQCAAAALLERVNQAPLWWSTAGLGVPWLHLRIDSRPKYYRHQPYQAAR